MFLGGSMKFYILYDVGAVSQYDFAKIVEAVDMEAALRMAFEEGYKELADICRKACRGMSFNAYPIFDGVDLTDKNTHWNLCNGALTPTALNMLEVQMAWGWEIA
jgi:hypothetical protein